MVQRLEESSGQERLLQEVQTTLFYCLVAACWVTSGSAVLLVGQVKGRYWHNDQHQIRFDLGDLGDLLLLHRSWPTLQRVCVCQPSVEA